MDALDRAFCKSLFYNDLQSSSGGSQKPQKIWTFDEPPGRSHAKPAASRPVGCRILWQHPGVLHLPKTVCDKPQHIIVNSAAARLSSRRQPVCRPGGRPYLLAPRQKAHLPNIRWWPNDVPRPANTCRLSLIITARDDEVGHEDPKTRGQRRARDDLVTRPRCYLRTSA